MMNEDALKREICEVGRRVYQRGFAAANDGNITARLDDGRVLCTPTMHCKGFMQPDDIATIDMSGRQIGGEKQRSSEALLHLEIYRRRADVNSVVHCHPPHATAFAVAREPIPQCVLPEVEVFLGEVPIAPYETPGGQAFADAVAPYLSHTSVVVLANHGTVSFGETVERAYWWTEILDAYCRILLLARQLGGVNYLGRDKARELLELKKAWGWTDARLLGENRQCDVCGNAVYRSRWAQAGVRPRAFPTADQADLAEGEPGESTGEMHPAPRGLDVEMLAEKVAERVLKKLVPLLDRRNRSSG